jgi:hypothetical protein
VIAIKRSTKENQPKKTKRATRVTRATFLAFLLILGLVSIAIFGYLIFQSEGYTTLVRMMYADLFTALKGEVFRPLTLFCNSEFPFEAAFSFH